MNNRTFFVKGLLAIVLLGQSAITFGQRNFYHRFDVGSSNIYTFAGSNLITGYANYLSSSILFDNSYTYSFYNGNYNGGDIKTKKYEMTGLTARDLLDDCFAGVKLGYQSDNMGSLNWGLYASAHYKINQFRMQLPTSSDYSGECAQYVKPGVGMFLTFGSVESKTKVQIEGAVRYDMPISYKGYFGKKADELNTGLSSHIAVKLAGYTWISAGIFADINHYDLYKNMGNGSKFKVYNVGLTFTITPKRMEDIYD